MYLDCEEVRSTVYANGEAAVKDHEYPPKVEEITDVDKDVSRKLTKTFCLACWRECGNHYNKTTHEVTEAHARASIALQDLLVESAEYGFVNYHTGRIDFVPANELRACDIIVVYQKPFHELGMVLAVVPRADTMAAYIELPRNREMKIAGGVKVWRMSSVSGELKKRKCRVVSSEHE
jgi:hypothetical protein